MAKFTWDFDNSTSQFSAENTYKTFSVDELLEVIRPAGMRLVEIYRDAIKRRFKQRTGSLASSIDFDDDVVGRSYAFITVKPFGTHKGGMYTRKSRAGSPDRKYAKHNRAPAKKAIKNEELAYLLEYGTPRIDATHWMEHANDESEEEIMDIIEAEYDKLLKKKGLI